MYVSSAGAGAGDCEGEAALEPNCGNDQPVAKLLRSSLEPLLIKHQVRRWAFGLLLLHLWFGSHSTLCSCFSETVAFLSSFPHSSIANNDVCVGCCVFTLC